MSGLNCFVHTLAQPNFQQPFQKKQSLLSPFGFSTTIPSGTCILYQPAQAELKKACLRTALKPNCSACRSVASLSA
eukprot:285794-Pelagomonas_calceolata.AAC.7